jgi:hypothetical protein
MKRIIVFLILLLPAGFFSCDEFLTDPDKLTTEEVIEGLKTALMVGTDSSVAITSALNGYYGDPDLKILLPEAADVILDNVNNPLLETLGVSQIINNSIDNVILSINRAAETAATDAGPVFTNAITSLSITDAWNILRGTNPAATKKSDGFDSTAATHYLISTTYDALVTAFSPYINNALDKDLGLGFSTNQAWNTLTTNYNTAANSPLDLFDKLKPVETTDIGEYAVGKALDGLFLKVGEEEVKIRRDPWAWASSLVGDILTKVFGGE